MIALPRLYALTDRGLAGGRPLEEIVQALCRGGVRLIQLREKHLPDGALLEAARGSVAAAHAMGARLVVNDRCDVAELAGADGVHLGDADLPPAAARRLLRDGSLIGVSSHAVEEAVAAGRLPVDYVALGPVFETSHAAVARRPVGLDAVGRAAAGLGVPLVAIGGITLENAPSVLAAGAASVAVMGDLMTAPDLTQRASAWFARLASI